MSAPGSTVKAHARELLARVAAANRLGRFRLREVCPLDAAAFLIPLSNLVEFGYVAEVRESVGKWHYAVTGTGRAALAGTADLIFGDCIAYPERHYEPTGTGYADGLCYRQGRRPDQR